MKGGNPNKVEEIFQRLKRDGCKPSTETYTMLINLYGKVRFIKDHFNFFSLKFYIFKKKKNFFYLI